MFGSVGAVHDHHDEPWHHIVDVSGPDVVSGIQRNDVVGPQPWSHTMAELGSGDAFVGITSNEEFHTACWVWYDPFVYQD